VHTRVRAYVIIYMSERRRRTLGILVFRNTPAPVIPFRRFSLSPSPKVLNTRLAIYPGMGKMPAGLARYWRNKRAGRRSRTGGTRMARRSFRGRVRRYGRKAKGYRPKSLIIPIGVGLGLASVAYDSYVDAKANTGGDVAGGFMKSMIGRLTGYNTTTGKWSSSDFMLGGGRLLVIGAATYAVHRVSAMTVNRYLPKGIRI